MRETAVIALDIGGTSIKSALITEKGCIMERIKVPTEPQKGLESIVLKIKNLTEVLYQKSCAFQVGGIGVGVPGWTDQDSGIVRLAPNLGWREVDLLVRLKDFKQAPVFLENDANLAALGESWLGTGKNEQDFLLITIGTGIGSGLILQGKIHRGQTGLGAEIGHMILEPHGNYCSCGNRGCLETLTAAPAIIGRVKGLNDTKTGKAWCQKENLGVKEIFAWAQKKDPLALKAVETTADYLAMAFVNIALLIDIPLIIMGGGVSHAGSVLLEPVRKALTARMDCLPQKSPEIRLAALGNDAGLLGAAKMVFDQTAHVSLQNV